VGQSGIYQLRIEDGLPLDAAIARRRLSAAKLKLRLALPFDRLAQGHAAATGESISRGSNRAWFRFEAAAGRRRSLAWPAPFHPAN
jgi:hypothetical protein